MKVAPQFSINEAIKLVPLERMDHNYTNIYRGTSAKYLEQLTQFQTLLAKVTNNRPDQLGLGRWHLREHTSLQAGKVSS